MKKRLLFFVIVFLFCDFFVKAVFASNENICNRGVSFGILLPKMIFLACFVFLCITLVVWLVRSIRKNDLVTGYCLAAVLSGAFMNMYERIRFGCVIDYIKIVDYFPRINVSDVFIFCGSVCLAWNEYRKKI